MIYVELTISYQKNTLDIWDVWTSKSSTLVRSTAMDALCKIIQMCSLRSDNQIKQSVEHKTVVKKMQRRWYIVYTIPGPFNS